MVVGNRPQAVIEVVENHLARVTGTRHIADVQRQNLSIRSSIKSAASVHPCIELLRIASRSFENTKLRRRSNQKCTSDPLVATGEIFAPWRGGSVSAPIFFA